MKKVVSLLAFLIFCGTVFSQGVYVPIFPTIFGQTFNRIKPYQVLHIPEKNGLALNTSDTTAQIFYNKLDSSFWCYSKAKGYFKATGGTGSYLTDTSLIRQIVSDSTKRFGIQDNLGLLDRKINIGNNDFEIISKTYDVDNFGASIGMVNFRNQILLETRSTGSGTLLVLDTTYVEITAQDADFNSKILTVSPKNVKINGNDVVTSVKVNGTTVLADSAGLVDLGTISGSGGGTPVIQTITSGTTATVTDSTTWFIVNPSALLTATVTLTMPPAPTNGKIVQFSFGGTLNAASTIVLSTLTFAPNSGQGIVGTTSFYSLEVEDRISFRYNSSNSKWYQQ